jgi:hypothetical protein
MLEYRRFVLNLNRYRGRRQKILSDVSDGGKIFLALLATALKIGDEFSSLGMIT